MFALEGDTKAQRVVDVRSTLSLTSALDGVEGQRHTPATLPPGKTRYPFCGRKGGLQGRSGRVGKISTPTDSDPGRSIL